ncbi:MAG: amino acid permease [Candidatus Diapherotrites archaeon]|nr:amino acid permease [Candidatus Diapherotrites archaeon]
MALHKTLGFFTLTMYGVGLIVGAGIYALIGEATGVAGNGIWLSFLLGAIIASFTGLSYAELSSAYQSASAEADYVNHASKKKWLSFIVGWLVIVCGFVAASTVSLGFAGYLTTIIPMPVILIAISLIIALSLLDLLGVDVCAKVNIIFTIISITGVLIVIFLGLPHLGSINYFEFKNGFSGVIGATSIIFFAYIGFEAIVKFGEETKQAAKVLPRALLASIAISSILYILLSISAISILPHTELSETSAPLAAVAAKAVNPEFGFVLMGFALFAMLSTVLVGLIVTSRLLYGLAEKHDLPRIFLKTHHKTGAPYIAVLSTMIGAIALVFLGDITAVAKATTFMVFVTFLAVNLALIFLRYHNAEYFPTFRQPANIGNFPVIAGLGAAASFCMLFEYSFIEVGITLAFVGIGVIIYFLEKRA